MRSKYQKTDYFEYDVCSDPNNSNNLIRNSGMYQDDVKLSNCSVNWLSTYFPGPYGSEFEQYVDKIPQVMLRTLAFNEGYDLKDENNYYKSDEELCNIVNSTKPSKKWLKSQVEYLNSLSDYQKAILTYYTYQGDKVINAYLSGNPGKVHELIDDRSQTYEGLEEVLEHNDEHIDENTDIIALIADITDEFNRIIRNAPKLDKDIIVYRGVSDKDYFKTGKHETKTVTSTSLWINVSMIYPQKVHDDVYGFLAFIKILAGTSVLFIGVAENSVSVFPWEKEILIPSGTTYTVSDTFEEIEMVNLAPAGNDDVLTYGFCLSSDNPRKVIMTNVSIDY